MFSRPRTCAQRSPEIRQRASHGSRTPKGQRAFARMLPTASGCIRSAENNQGSRKYASRLLNRPCHCNAGRQHRTGSNARSLHSPSHARIPRGAHGIRSRSVHRSTIHHLRCWSEVGRCTSGIFLASIFPLRARGVHPP